MISPIFEPWALSPWSQPLVHYIQCYSNLSPNPFFFFFFLELKCSPNPTHKFVIEVKLACSYIGKYNIEYLHCQWIWCHTVAVHEYSKQKKKTCVFFAYCSSVSWTCCWRDLTEFINFWMYLVLRPYSSSSLSLSFVAWEKNFASKNTSRNLKGYKNIGNNKNNWLKAIEKKQELDR